MVAAFANHDSVFSVLARAARARSPRSLTSQVAVCLALASGILVAAPQWWSVAAILGAPAAYALWGVAIRVAEERTTARVVRMLPRAVAVVGTLLVVAGCLGLAAALFAGNGRSPYNACGRDATTPLCRAWANPPRTSQPIP